jgi:hypothetical protein
MHEKRCKLSSSQGEGAQTALATFLCAIFGNHHFARRKPGEKLLDLKKGFKKAGNWLEFLIFDSMTCATLLQLGWFGRALT